MPLTAPGTSDTMQRVLHFSKSACLQHAAYQRRGPQHLLCRHALKPRPPALNRQQHRCMAFYGGGGRDKRNDDPSLAEIGTELISKVK